MSSRMDKYDNNQVIPTRSDRNKELYKQVYNAYDEFENLIVPSNAKEIKFKDLKKELITSREDYQDQKIYNDITSNTTNNTVIRKEILEVESKHQNEIYDINELLDKAVVDNRPEEIQEPTLANQDYLKKLKLDNRKTNLEQVKEMYDEIREEAMDENLSLLQTANLSLEILSDLKSDDEVTKVMPVIKNGEEPSEEEDNTFYSNEYEFTKDDFEDKSANNKSIKTTDEDEEDEDDEDEDDTGSFFIKVLLLVLGVIVIGLVMYILIRYFNKA